MKKRNKMKKPLQLIVAFLLLANVAFAEGIKFDKARYGVSAGESVELKYTLPREGEVIVNATEGWLAEVTASDGSHGIIKMTAPDPTPAVQIWAAVVYPGAEEEMALLPLMVKDPYTDATRPTVDLLPFGGLEKRNTTAVDYQKVKDAGFTMITLEGGEKYDMNGDGVLDDEDMMATLRFKLDLIKNAGLKYSLHHPQLASVIEAVKDDPDLQMIHIFDEPGLWLIPQLKQRRDWIKSIAPEVPVHINLHPEASIRAMGTDFYRDYITKMVEGTGMDILSYDQYPVWEDNTIMNYWYKCMEVNSEVARSHGIPFWAFTASCWMNDEHRRMPDMANMRLQVYTDFAYGAQVVQYFVYRAYTVSTLAPIMSDGRYTELYDLLKEFNAEMHKRGFVFAGGKVTKTRFTHLTPWCCLPLLASDLPEEIASVDSEITALVSFEENAGGNYLIMVNSSCSQKCTATVEFNSPVYTVGRDGSFTEHQPGKEKFVMDEGDMLVIKYR